MAAYVDFRAWFIIGALMVNLQQFSRKLVHACLNKILCLHQVSKLQYFIKVALQFSMDRKVSELISLSFINYGNSDVLIIICPNLMCKSRPSTPNVHRNPDQ
jgi:hypothetical protein